ncbi:MAG: UDP-N-acetylmuramoyl-L-alanine--D-glutamate ligase, partial [Luteimonas sp.]
MRCSPLSVGQLDGKSVALWGWGREGRAAYRAIRAQLPQFPLTLFCSAAESVDAGSLADASLTVDTEASAARLSAFEIVIKSPGISPYKPEALAAAEQGTRFISGTTLWFAEHPRARTLCVTGTKGK